MQGVERALVGKDCHGVGHVLSSRARAGILHVGEQRHIIRVPPAARPAPLIVPRQGGQRHARVGELVIGHRLAQKRVCPHSVEQLSNRLPLRVGRDGLPVLLVCFWIVIRSDGRHLAAVGL